MDPKLSVQVEVTIMSSDELFVELSDKEQEVVAGGAIAQGSFLTTATSVNNILGFTGGSQASAAGASSGVTLAAGNVVNSTLTVLGPVVITP